jgi:hypothetical protein
MPRTSLAATAARARLPHGDRYRAVGRLVKQVFQSLVRRIDQRMQPLELTAMQWEPLLLLFNQRVDTVAALARESHVNCGAMTRKIDRLEGKELLPIVRHELQVHLRDFTDEEISTLIGLLSRMLKNGAQDA